MNGLPPELIAKLTGEATAAQKLAVTNKMNDCFAILRAKFPQYHLVEPKITYDLKGAVAGRAYGGSRIELNIDLLNSKHYDDILERTLPHEIAHIVTYQIWIKQGGYTRACKPHGRQWQYIMNCLGLAANRCHNYEVNTTAQPQAPTRLPL